MIETMQNTILAQHGIAIAMIAMLDFNHSAEDALVIC
jgi:hypothetical protein